MAFSPLLRADIELRERTEAAEAALQLAREALTVIASLPHGTLAALRFRYHARAALEATQPTKAS